MTIKLQVLIRNSFPKKIIATRRNYVKNTPRVLLRALTLLTQLLLRTINLNDSAPGVK